MGITVEGRITRSIAVLDEQRQCLREAGARFAAELLDIALLELRRQLHGVSDGELAQLAAAVEQQLMSAGPLDSARPQRAGRDPAKLTIETN